MKMQNNVQSRKSTTKRAGNLAPKTNITLMTQTKGTVGVNRLGFVRFPLSMLCSSVKLAPGMHTICRHAAPDSLATVPLEVPRS